MRKRNKLFLTEITPACFENIYDLSKYMVIDIKGTVRMVTNYKDSEECDGPNWKDDSGLILKKVVPILSK